MSNNFPKVSPDNKFIVFVKCKNGLLMRPDSKLWIVPVKGGKARMMSCNTERMNSWHSWSPNGRWLVFSSKANTFYTQMFLTHIDEKGNDSPPILIPHSTAANRAVNLPEFVNIRYDDLYGIEAPAVNHYWTIRVADSLISIGQKSLAEEELQKALPLTEDLKVNARVLPQLGGILLEPESAFIYLKEAVKIDPEYDEAYFILAEKNEIAGRTREAIGNYRKSIMLNPNHFRDITKLALIYLLS